MEAYFPPDWWLTKKGLLEQIICLKSPIENHPQDFGAFE